MPENDKRIEYLQTVQTQNAATQHMLHGVRLITIAGVEGIQETAKTDPDILLAAIVGLAGVVEKQQEQVNGLVENWLESLDNVEEIGQTIRRALAR